MHVKAVADSALRCAGLSLCCVCGSSAASTSAVQLEYQQEQEQRKRSMEHRQEISSLHCVAVQAATHSVEFYLSPRFFLKEMAIFTHPLAKFSPAARTKAPPPLLGGAARPKSATLTVTIIHAWSRPVVDVPGTRTPFPRPIHLTPVRASHTRTRFQHECTRLFAARVHRARRGRARRLRRHRVSAHSWVVINVPT